MTENKNDLTYKDVLKAEETLNNDKVVFAQWTNMFKMTDEERKKAVEEILLQPYMEDIYRTHCIEPRDVKEFIETVKASRTLSENIIANNSNAFQQNKDNSKDMDGDGKSDGDNTKIDSYEEKEARKRQLTKAYEKVMHDFAVQKAIERMPKEAEKTKLQKGLHNAGKLVVAFLKVGRIAVIAGGVALGVYAAREYYNINEKDNKTPDKNNVTSKADTKTNDKNSKVYMDWAKHNNDRRC